MPTATLTFNLPDEEPDFADAIDGTDLRMALQDLDTALRNRLKYGMTPETKTPEQAYQEIRDTLHQCLDDHDLKLFP